MDRPGVSVLRADQAQNGQVSEQTGFDRSPKTGRSQEDARMSPREAYADGLRALMACRSEGALRAEFEIT